MGRVWVPCGALRGWRSSQHSWGHLRRTHLLELPPVLVWGIVATPTIDDTARQPSSASAPQAAFPFRRWPSLSGLAGEQPRSQAVRPGHCKGDPRCRQLLVLQTWPATVLSRNSETQTGKRLACRKECVFVLVPQQEPRQGQGRQDQEGGSLGSAGRRGEGPAGSSLWGGSGEAVCQAS